MRNPKRSNQRGTVAIIAAIALPILIGFVGLALDGGHLYLQKTELQNAADACALAAASALTCDPAAGPCAASYLVNAENVGLAVAQANRIDFQANTIGASQITASDIKFSTTFTPNSSYLSRADGANPASKYVMCTTHQNGILPWFMGVLGFGGQNINAYGVATLLSAQTNCAIPIGMCKLDSAPSSDPFAGLTIGQWISSKLTKSATGSFDWVDFTPPSGGAKELADLLTGKGACSVPPPPTQVGEQGNKASLDTAWNTRFGIYKAGYDTTNATPDFTGASYTPTSWPEQANAYSGTSATGMPNFITARTQYRSYNPVLPPLPVDGLGLGGGTSTSDHKKYGADRRLVTAPLVDCSAWAAKSTSQQVPILGYACVLMLQPMTNKSTDEVWLEYRGKSTDPASPCATSGSVGGPGSVGPLVPSLVQ